MTIRIKKLPVLNHCHFKLRRQCLRILKIILATLWRQFESPLLPSQMHPLGLKSLRDSSTSQNQRNTVNPRSKSLLSSKKILFISTGNLNKTLRIGV